MFTNNSANQMKSCASLLKINNKYRESRVPLVFKRDPFVSINITRIMPFVLKKHPSVENNGFTLIELMVTLAVVAIVSMIAIPSMRTIIQNNRISTQLNDLLADISLARSEAIRSTSNTQICAWNSITNPTNPACDGGTNWSNGRVICADRDNDGVFCEAGEQVRSHERLSSMTLTPAIAVNSLTFSSRGALPPGPVVDFRLCDFRGVASAKLIRITSVGQASVPTSAVPICP